MKRFKNKFTGDVATFTNESGYKLNSEVIGLIPAKYIENSNDWEEVEQEVKKDYEILSVRSVGGNHILTSIKANMLGYKNLDLHVSNTKDWEVHSIKRLSDGEIFTIGDTLKVQIRLGEVKIIKRISFMKEGVIWLGWKNGASNFRTAKKVHHLFKSCDGVEIFEGQIWWYVAHDKMVAKQTDTLVYRGRSSSEVSHFSTREKAEMWIRNNRKPNFITEDGVKIFTGDKYWSVIASTFQMWEGTCGLNTTANKELKHFSSKCEAEKYKTFNAPVLSLNDVAKIYVSATKEVTAFTAMSAQNRRIQNLVISKLTNHGKEKA